MQIMKAYIAGDHYTVELMGRVEAFLAQRDIAFENYGSMDPDTSIKLQEIIPAVAEAVRSDPGSIGVLVCGTGAGVEIGANRFRGIRASLCTQARQAENARIYDNANVLCLGSWLTDDPEPILEAWLDNEFDGDPGRTQMIADFDEWS